MATKSRPCERCGVLIPVERIETVPETRLCMPCSQETGGDTCIRVRTRRSGKAGSLKGTGVEIEEAEVVRRKRRPEQE